MPTKIVQTKNVRFLTRITYEGKNYMPGTVIEIPEPAWDMFLNRTGGEIWAEEVISQPMRTSSFDVSEADNALQK